MKYHTKRIIVIFLAALCIIVGLAGLILPIIPGIAFLILGLLLLSMYSRRVDKWARYLTEKHPLSHQTAEKLRAMLDRIIGKP